MWGSWLPAQPALILVVVVVVVVVGSVWCAGHPVRSPHPAGAERHPPPCAAGLPNSYYSSSDSEADFSATAGSSAGGEYSASAEEWEEWEQRQWRQGQW